jgi:hypothetical protein
MKAKCASRRHVKQCLIERVPETGVVLLNAKMPAEFSVQFVSGPHPAEFDVKDELLSGHALNVANDRTAELFGAAPLGASARSHARFRGAEQLSIFEDSRFPTSTRRAVWGG